MVPLRLPSAAGDPGGRSAFRWDVLYLWAANWIPLGQTQALGQMARYRQADRSARKLVFVYPLCRHVQQRLREAQPPCFSQAEADADWA